MTYLIKTVLTTFVALTTITLLALSTKAESSSGNDNPASKRKTGEVAPVSTGTAKLAGEPPEVISGDLGSVDWRSLVGQNVTIEGDLVVVDTHNLVRYGQVEVARHRLYVPTSKVDPNDADANATSFEGGSNVAKVVEAQKFNDKATIIIDDGSAKQNIFPPTLFPELGRTLPTVRIGSTIKGCSGRLVKAGSNFLLVPNQPLQWTPAERPKRPDMGKSRVTVSSFNVLNYFTTIDNGRNDARGADSETELQRQEAKLVSAIIALDADVVGLMEIENNEEAEIRLVAALNKKIGKQVFTGCGLPDGFRRAPGGQDAIRVGIIYRSDRVKTVGPVSIVTDDAFYKARTPIVQSFKSKSTKPFTVIVNHFKSKNSASSADVANKNKGDGQGAYNSTRRSQSLAICNYIDQLVQRDSKTRALVIGDLNAYSQEDPIDAMRARGLVDLQERFEKTNPSGNADEPHYSYVYRGKSGSLDHAMATDSLVGDVTGIATWHINADEPRSMDYNQEYNPKALYEANPFRSSDHDPVLIGIGK